MILRGSAYQPSRSARLTWTSGAPYCCGWACSDASAQAAPVEAEFREAVSGEEGNADQIEGQRPRPTLKDNCTTHHQTEGVFTLNTKFILTRAAVLAGSAGLLASLGAVGASAASASTHRNQTLIATTKIVNRYDGGGSGYWAYDSFGRVLNLQYLGKVTPAMIAANPALASTPYMYTATLTDKGTFKDIPGALTPNQGGRNSGKVLRPTQVTGSMSGYGDFSVFYASQKAAGYRGDAYTVPPALHGSARNLLYPSSTWPELAFANGTTFSGVSETGYSYTYTVVKTVHGKHVRVQTWVDSAWNGDGQLPGDGNITG